MPGTMFSTRPLKIEPNKSRVALNIEVEQTPVAHFSDANFWRFDVDKEQTRHERRRAPSLNRHALSRCTENVQNRLTQRIAGAFKRNLRQHLAYV